jgi:general L-amino acid transport system permease protein
MRKILRWLRENLFSTWYNTLLTAASVWLAWVVLSGLFAWAVRDAVWSGGSAACQQARQLAQSEGRPWGACWAVIPANIKLLMAGTYPPGELWRIWVSVYLAALLVGASAGVWRGLLRETAIAIGAGALVLALLPFSTVERLWIGGIALALFVPMGIFWKARALRAIRWAVGAGWLVLPVIVLILISGLPPWLPRVETTQWGGLLLTVILAVVGIVASFPLGVLLALGRQSELPVIRWFSILYIEVVRGVPLVTVIFMASLVLPLFLPGNLRIDQAVRALVAFTLFTAAYIAENVRGGLQAIPRGQIEAARALGLHGWLITLFIVLPQALRAVIPANVGQFISLFKDTSLVFVAALLDLFNMGRSILANPEWLGFDGEMVLFIAFVYWVCTYSMAYLSRRLEKILGVGER